MDDQLLRALLLQPLPLHSQHMSAPATLSKQQTTSRQPRRAWQAAGVGVMLGSVLALSPLNGVAAPAVEPTREAAPVMIQAQADAIAADRRSYSGTVHLRVRAAAANEQLSVPPPLEPGQALIIPVVEDTPSSDRAQQAASIVYTVQPGDTLSDIAWRHYGNATLWPLIHEVNQFIANPHLIYPGQRLTIPEYTGRGPVPENPSPGTYVVQSGDSLWLIAQRHYGDGMGYWSIYQANANQISDPSLIFPGMVLRIP
jgi:LysM repeat protein